MGIKASVFIATSLDGFIARQDGSLDWLPADGGEPHGYDEFIATVDAIVMGRKTFEKVLTFKAWPYGKTPVFVLTTRPLPLNPRLLGSVETMADRPPEVVRRLARAGLHRLYLDGGRTIQGFLRAGVVDEITITRVPVLLGGGVPLFGALPADVRLRHVDTRAFPSGLVQTTYEVKRERRKPQKGESVQAEIDRLLRSRGSGEPAVSPPTLPLPEATAPDAREDPPSAPAAAVEVDPPVVDAEIAVASPVADPDPFFNAPSPDSVDDSPIGDPDAAGGPKNDAPVTEAMYEHAMRPAAVVDDDSPIPEPDPAVRLANDEE